MPRSPQSVVTYRGPFRGQQRASPLRVPPQACWDSRNVETRSGDIRRRPGLTYFGARGVEGALNRALRMECFFNTSRGGTPLKFPYLAIAAHIGDDAEPPFGLLVRSGFWGYESNEYGPLYLTGELGEGDKQEYRFGLCPLGAGLLLRPRSGAPAVLYKETGQTAWVNRPLFLAKPASMGVAITPGTGGLGAGTYYYTATFGNHYTGAVSPACLDRTCAYNGIAVTATQIVRVTIGAPADLGVDRVRIYRKLYGVDTEWYCVKDAAPTDWPYVWDDLGVAFDKTAAARLDVLASYTPAAGGDAVLWRGRLWLDESPSTLCYSDYDSPWAFRLTQSLAAGDDAGDDVRRLVPMAGVLFILKHNSIFAVTGSGPDSFEVQELARGGGVGLASDHAVLSVAGRVYYAGWDGLYRLDGQGLTRLSDAVADRWAAYRDLHWRTLVYDPGRELLLVSGYTDTVWGALQTLVLHLPSGDWHTWQTGHFGGTVGYPDRWNGPRPVLQVQPGAGDARLAEGGYAKFRTDDDPEQRDYESAAVPWYYDQGHTDGGTHYPKKLSHAAAAWVADPLADGAPLELGVSLDQAVPVDLHVAAANGTPPLAVWPVGRVCRTFGLRIGGTHAWRPRITELALEAEGIGQR